MAIAKKSNGDAIGVSEFDVERIRADFPVLPQMVNGKARIIEFSTLSWLTRWLRAS